jgi:uncharacterized membrane protein
MSVFLWTLAIVGQAADFISTEVALDKRGFREANPIFSKYRDFIIGGKFAAVVFCYFLSQYYANQGDNTPAMAIPIMVAIAGFGAAMYNIMVMRSHGRH